MSFRLGFIEKKIANKRMTLLVLAGMLAVGALVIGILNVLDDQQRVYSFHFNPQTVITGTQQNFSVAYNDVIVMGGVPLPGPGRTENRRYISYLLEGDEYAVVMLVRWQLLNRVDLSGGTVRLRLDSEYARFHQNIINDQRFGGPVIYQALERMHDQNKPIYVRIYMAQLRHKLEGDPSQPIHLITELQVGYRLSGLGIPAGNSGGGDARR